MFAQPLLLALLPLALAPVALHLRWLARPRTVDLPTFRFLIEGRTEHRRWSRLRDVWVMLLRALAIALLVLALSGPSRDLSEAWSRGSSPVTLVLDAGAAMDLRSGGQSSLDRAKRAANAALIELDPDTPITLVRMGHGASVLAKGLAAEHARLAGVINAVRSDPAATSVERLASHLAGEGEQLPASRVLIFTDLQRRAWESVRGSASIARLAKQHAVTLVDAGPEDPQDHVGVWWEARGDASAPAGMPVPLRALVVNHSPRRSAQAVVTLMMQEQAVARHTLTLGPGERRTWDTAYTPPSPGVHRGLFTLQPDAFPSDDAAAVVVRATPPVAVTLVKGPARAEPRDRASVFVGVALRAASAAPGQPRDAAAALAVQTIPQSELREGTIERSEVVVMADVEINPFRGQLLRAFLQSGGGVVAFPGESTDPDAWNRLLLPDSVRMGPARGDPASVESFLTTAPSPLAHPMNEGWEILDKDGPAFTGARFHRVFPLLLPPGSRDAVPWRLSDGAPLAVAVRTGRGRLALWAAPASARWSDLPLKPMFVPALLRSVLWARREPEVAAPPAAAPFTPFDVRWASTGSQTRVEVIDPAQRRTELAGREVEGGGAARVESLDSLGHHTLRVTTDRPGGPQRVELAVAVQLDPAHADFVPLTHEAARAIFAPGSIQLARAGEVITRSLSPNPRRVELGPWLLALAIALSLAELAVAVGRGAPARAPGSLAPAAREAPAAARAGTARASPAPAAPAGNAYVPPWRRGRAASPAGSQTVDGTKAVGAAMRPSA